MTLCVHHIKLNLLLSSHIWLYLPLSTSSSTTVYSGNHYICVNEFLFVYLVCYFQIYISHMTEIIWFSTFIVSLILLSMIVSRYIHVVTNGSILSFSWLSNIPLYKCIISFLSNHLLKGIPFVVMSWTPWIMLQWTLRCIYLYR